MQHQIKSRLKYAERGTMNADNMFDYPPPQTNPNVIRLLEKIKNGPADTPGNDEWESLEDLLESSHFTKTELTSGLLGAVEASNVVVFDRLVKEGGQISHLQTKDALNVLINNGREPNLPLLDHLLRGGLNPNCKNGKGFTPLWFSASLGFEDYVIKLLECNAQVDTRNGQAMSTALHIACNRGLVRIARLLLSHGADVNLTSSHGCTALHFAAKGLSVECVHEVLRAGADPNVRDTTSFGYTPLYSALATYHPDGVELGPIIDELISHGADVNASVGEKSYSPLKMAIDCGLPLNVLEKLVDANTDLDRCDPLSPLHFAAHRSRSDVVGWLVSQGCLANVTTESGETPLHIAASSNRQGSLTTCEALLAAGSNVNAMNKEGRTPLMKVWGLKEALNIYELFLANSANPDHRDKHGRTPLVNAIEISYCGLGCRVQNEMTRLLLKYNCDPDLKGLRQMQHDDTSQSDHVRPIFTSLAMGNVQVAEMLNIAGCNLHGLMQLKYSLEEKSQGRFKAVIVWLEETLTQPRTLKTQVRTVIRGVLRWPKWGCHQQLPIPPALQSYITLPELEQCLSIT